MISFDLETTGLSHRRDKIIEVGMIKIGKTWSDLTEFHSLVNPCIKVASTRLREFGHTQAELDASPTIQGLKPQILEFMKNQRIIGYNIAFDKRFILHAGSEFNCFEYVDMLNYIRGLGYDLPNYRLTTVAAFFGIKTPDAHTALGDSRTVLELMKKVGTP